MMNLKAICFLPFYEDKISWIPTSKHSSDEHKEKSEGGQGDLAIGSDDNASNHKTTFDLFHPQS